MGGTSCQRVNGVPLESGTSLYLVVIAAGSLSPWIRTFPCHCVRRKDSFAGCLGGVPVASASGKPVTPVSEGHDHLHDANKSRQDTSSLLTRPECGSPGQMVRREHPGG